MRQVFINVIGHNASGKTYVAKRLAENLHVSRVSGDDFRTFVYEHVSYFESVNNSYPTEKNKQLNPLVVAYRLQLIDILLRAGQNLICDGSGFTREHRNKYLSKVKQTVPNIKTALVWTDVDESVLLERLAERDKASAARWTDMYFDVRKGAFEAPAKDEADVLLRYDQNNYDEIEGKLKELLA